VSKKFDLRVTVSANGQERVLFSVKDPPNGEMLISRKAPDTLRPNGLNPNAIPAVHGILPRVKEQRYSIHPSKESSDSNQLKATTTLASGKKIERYHVTKVIKTGHRYAPLFVQRCPKLDSVNYSKSNPGLQELSFGCYDPQHFTLCFGVFLAARDNEFPSCTPSLGDPVNVVQHQFRAVRLILMWNFLSLPSHSSSMASLFQTSAEAPQWSEGLTAQACCDHYIGECWNMEQELTRFVYLDEQKNDPREPVMIPLRRYFSDGMTFTQQAAEYFKMLSQRSVLLAAPGARRTVSDTQ